MSQRQRFGLLAVAAVVAVGAFVVLRPDGDSSDDGSTQTTATPSPRTERGPSGDATAPETTPATPKPRYVQIRARGLQPVGGVKEITVKAGDTVRLAVSSDQVDEGHLHGYDISKPVGPGKTARYKFKADIEGVFELELENASVPLASLSVEP